MKKNKKENKNKNKTELVLREYTSAERQKRVSPISYGEMQYKARWANRSSLWVAYIGKLPVRLIYLTYLKKFPFYARHKAAKMTAAPAPAAAAPLIFTSGAAALV